MIKDYKAEIVPGYFSLVETPEGGKILSYNNESDFHDVQITIYDEIIRGIMECTIEKTGNNLFKVKDKDGVCVTFYTKNVRKLTKREKKAIFIRKMIESIK